MSKATKVKPVLAFEDTQNIAGIRHLVRKDLLGALEELVETFNTLNVGRLTSDDLRRLVEGPDGLVKEKLANAINDVPVFGGFRMKMEDIISQLELPDLSPLIAAAAKVRRVSGSRLYLFLGLYDLVENTIAVNESALEAYLEGSRTYAVTEGQVEVLNAYNALIEAYNDLDALLKKYPSTSGGLGGYPLQLLINRAPGAGNAVINPAIYNEMVRNLGNIPSFNRNALE